MAIIGIFECEVCGKETRLDRTPNVERGSIEVEVGTMEGFQKISFADTCSDCVSAIYYGVLEIVENLRKQSA